MNYAWVTLSLLAWCTPALAAHAEWEVTLRDELRLRERLVQDIGKNAVAMDVEIDPTLGVAVEGSGGRLDLTYLPRLLMRQPYRQAAPVMLHTGRAGQSLTYGRFRGSLSETVSYGEQDFSSLTQLVAVNGRLQPLPTVSHLPYSSIGVTFDGAYRLSRRWSVGMFGYFLESGGTTAIARAQLPRQDTGRAQFSLSWQAGLRHRLEAMSGATLFFFDQGQRYVLADLLAGWEWQAAKATRVIVRGGAAVVTNRANNAAQERLLFLPNASLSVTQRLAGTRRTSYELTYGLSYAPLFDRITGEVYARPTADLGLGVLFSPSWALRAGGSVGFALRNQQDSRDMLAFGSMSLVHTTRSSVAFEFGVRGFIDVFVYQPKVAPYTQWVGYLATTFGTKERF